jgi:hypothetical protein
MEVDRLHITPLFSEMTDKKAAVPRWATNKGDFDLSQDSGFVALVRSRPIVQVMHLADYDHDGARSEFYLQTLDLPCGKSTGVVIGVSRKNARLHAFGTAQNPNRPLELQRGEWEALRDSKSPHEIIDWKCGDHMALTETRLWLRATPNGIDGAVREYACDGSERLISEKPL